MKPLLAKLCRREDLSAAETTAAFEQMMSGTLDPAVVGGLLLGLAVKGVTADELTGAAVVMRQNVVPVDVGGGPILDTCGTGGDHSGTFNISTAAAIVAAACGVRVVKHGNRSASSKSGSADVLEALGVNIDCSPEALRQCLDAAGICFCFARNHHPAMKHVAAVRMALGVPTVFNLLGPLTNPAGAKRQLIGVYRSDLTELLAHVLQRLGSERAWVVNADDGLDECSTSSPTRVSELKDGQVRTWTLNPRELGVEPASAEELRVDGPAESAAMIRRVLEPEVNGARGAREVVALNAAAALVVAGGAEDVAEGLATARGALESGRAAETLERLVEASGR